VHSTPAAGAFNSGGEICIACHTTHNTDLTVAAEAPLWNHDLTTNGDFSPYVGFDMQSTPTDTVNTGSLLCLSCHDGTISLDAFGGGGGGPQMTGAANVTKNLTDDHPISMAYAGDTGLNAASSTTELGGTITADYLNGGTTVECFSCHNVHNDVGTAAKLLKVDNAGSVLCLDCHAK
jgi:predicted CXXCH cytochrome family protein